MFLLVTLWPRPPRLGLTEALGATPATPGWVWSLLVFFFPSLKPRYKTAPNPGRGLTAPPGRWLRSVSDSAGSRPPASLLFRFHLSSPDFGGGGGSHLHLPLVSPAFGVTSPHPPNLLRSTQSVSPAPAARPGGSAGGGGPSPGGPGGWDGGKNAGTSRRDLPGGHPRAPALGLLGAAPRPEVCRELSRSARSTRGLPGSCKSRCRWRRSPCSPTWALGSPPRVR